jgi:hypothetical protein
MVIESILSYGWGNLDIGLQVKEKKNSLVQKWILRKELQGLADRWE